MSRRIWALTNRCHVGSWAQGQRALFVRHGSRHSGHSKYGLWKEDNSIHHTHPSRSLATRSSGSEPQEKLDVHPEVRAELVRRGFELSKVRKVSKNSHPKSHWNFIQCQALLPYAESSTWTPSSWSWTASMQRGVPRTHHLA